MRQQIVTLTLTATMTAMAGTAIARTGTERDSSDPADGRHRRTESSVQLGPRPFFLVNDMNDGRLKRKLQQCSEGPFKTSRVLDRPSRRRVAVPRTHAGGLSGGRADGGWHPRVRRDLHERPLSWCAGTHRTTCTPRRTSC